MSENTTETAIVTAATVTLSKPLQRGDTEIATITVNKPEEAGVLRGLKTHEVMVGDYDACATLLTRVTQPALTRAEIDRKITPFDFMQLQGELIGFLLPAGMRDSLMM